MVLIEYHIMDDDGGDGDGVYIVGSYMINTGRWLHKYKYN